MLACPIYQNPANQAQEPIIQLGLWNFLEAQSCRPLLKWTSTRGYWNYLVVFRFPVCTCNTTVVPKYRKRERKASAPCCCKDELRRRKLFFSHSVNKNQSNGKAYGECNIYCFRFYQTKGFCVRTNNYQVLERFVLTISV